MSTIATFTVPAGAFPLGHIFESFPEITIEIEQVVPVNDSILPYFWVRGEPVEHVRKALEERGALESYTLIDNLGDQGLFRAEWNPDVEGILTGIIDAELTVISATGTEDEWTFEFRDEDTAPIAEFQQYCADHGIDVTLGHIHSVGAPTDEGAYGLTTEQREAVLLAYENGYYTTPPETNLGELAEELGITHQSFSDRLRRGVHNLIEETLDVA
ncbi:helix-turn-helix domain-containing protein [Halopelagius longus]|uniref:DNA-binding protein n=1 Tax=Halopelagius longus TaxID=1236180 RepID=A0A1H0Z4A3_9EURY|nr:helix-turn-helix domain-containing protein [Halopelagius longus]RDI72824.1 DNA-binding protein [Halopelagius longus]SDQ22233.1 GAF and HTH_10 associated domain-containing protein [Halopelagius longus]